MISTIHTRPDQLPYHSTNLESRTLASVFPAPTRNLYLWIRRDPLVDHLAFSHIVSAVRIAVSLIVSCAAIVLTSST